MFKITFLLSLFLSFNAQAETDLPLPRFVSLRSHQVNLRTGPGFRYPVEWVYLKNDVPIEITAEFENWRKTRDQSGREGWIYVPMLSGRRTVRVLQEAFLRRAPNKKSLPLAKVEQNALGRLMLCPEKMELCKVEFENFQGWISKSELWGIYPDEIFE